MIFQTSVDVQSQRWYDWQTTDKSRDESLGSTAHPSHEFRRRRRIKEEEEEEVTIFIRHCLVISPKVAY